MSAQPVITAELTGKKIRKLGPECMLRTGDKLCNRYGQRLWTIEAFHPRGARVSQWPSGTVHDYTWDLLYGGFYKRVPEEEDVKSTEAEPVTEEWRLRFESSESARKSLADAFAAVVEERDNYLRWLRESDGETMRQIQRILELEWELNYAAHCVAENEELKARVRQLIIERDRYKARAEEKRALRLEIEQALGIESLPPDANDESLRRGLETIAALRARVAELEKDALRGAKMLADNATVWKERAEQAEQRNAELVAAGNALCAAYVAHIGTEKSARVDQWQGAARSRAESAKQGGPNG